jgi:hypothetical protein
LRDTPIGQAVKQGTSLSKPVTHCYKPESMGVNFSVNPAFLKPTVEGKLAKTKGDLQKPITAATVIKSDFDSLNFEANPMILKPTEKGSLVRLGERLERPITHIREAAMGATAEDSTTSSLGYTGDNDFPSIASSQQEDPFVQLQQEEGDNECSTTSNEGPWEDFSSQNEPSHSASLDDGDDLPLNSDALEAAFDNSFGHNSQSIVVDL